MLQDSVENTIETASLAADRATACSSNAWKEILDTTNLAPQLGNNNTLQDCRETPQKAPVWRQTGQQHVPQMREKNN